MTRQPTTDDGIAALAAQRAQAREHAHNPDGSICERIPHIPFAEGMEAYRLALAALTWCTNDHRTPAEQRADVLGKLADVWAYFDPDGKGVGWRFSREHLERMYDAIQRTEATE